jgi:hypothetical protein
MLKGIPASWRYGAALACIGLVASVRPAHAYIDPSAGSLILQTIIGGAAAGAIAVKLYWSKLKERFSPARKRQGPGAERAKTHERDGTGP